MIEIAFGLQNAVREAVNTERALDLAGVLLYQHQAMDEETMKATLFALVGEVASMASFYSAEVCLGDNMVILNDTIADLMNFEENN